MSRSEVVAAAQALLDLANALPADPAPARAAAIASVQALLDKVNALPGVVVPPVLPPLLRVAINLARFVCFDLHHHGTNYQRNQNHLAIKTALFTITIACSCLTGAAVQGFQYPQYGIFFGDQDNLGVEVARWTRPSPATKIANIPLTLPAGLADAPYLLRIVPYDAAGARVTVFNPGDESQVPWGAWVNRTGAAKDHPLVIFQNGSWDWLHGHKTPVGADYLFVLVPKAMLKDRNVPLDFHNIPSVDQPVNASVPHTFYGGEPFNTAPEMLDANYRPLANAQMRLERITFVPPTDNSQMCFRRPCITKDGITVTENNQAYTVNDFARPYPNQPYMDGLRGTGFIANITALLAGHAGSAYFLDPYSLGRVNFKGVVQRFVGMVHTERRYWGDMHPPTNGDPVDFSHIKLLGDWDESIPLNRRWIWEGWALFTDPRTLAQDPALPTINFPPFGQLPQHLGEGPVFYATSRFQCLVKTQFHKDRPRDPPRVTEFITGLGDPWGAGMI